MLITIRKAVDASPELRSKKALIETFIAGIHDIEDIMTEWRAFVATQREQELAAIIADERLKPEEAEKFAEVALQTGEVKTTGMDIDRILPPLSRFGGDSNGRSQKKQRVIDRFVVFVQKYFGI